ncbi:hypothetical protein RF55_19017 [Lasius niger]|uniref:Uncharacterized protein n=1 Tax=Lasius niger TaxID=67767 RepID=A0A0J7K0J8_LASNI|nr:hypothetical protein RF55_19017 [Lasius niger]
MSGERQTDNVLNIKCGYCGEILAVTVQEEIFHHKCLGYYDENKHAVSIDEDFVATITIKKLIRTLVMNVSPQQITVTKL